MKWLLVLSVTLIHNDGAWPSKTYELRGYTDFGQCSRAKADIDLSLIHISEPTRPY